MFPYWKLFEKDQQEVGWDPGAEQWRFTFPYAFKSG